MKDSVLILYVREEHEGNWCYVDSFIQVLEDAGFETVVVSNHEHHPLTRQPAAFYALDFSRPERNDQIVEIARKHRVKFAHSLGDWAANAIGNLNAVLGLPGFRNPALKTVINKDSAYEFAVQNGIRMPLSKNIKTRDEFDDPELQCPIIIKPTHGTGMVKIRNYDYLIFPSLLEFRDHLAETGQLDEFLENNRHPGFFGSHMVQKYVLHDRFVMVNFAYIQGKIEILQIGRHYYPAPYVIKPYAVGTPEVISDSLKTEILRIIRTYQKLGIDNTFASIQFLVDENEVPYPIDVHLRLGEAKGMLMATFEPRILAEAVRGMMGLPYDVSSKRSVYSLKYSLLLKPGKFDDIQFPKEDRVILCNMEHLMDEKEIPADPSFESLGSYFICTSPVSKESCWAEAKSFLERTKVTYASR